MINRFVAILVIWAATLPPAHAQFKLAPPTKEPEPIKGTLVIVGGGKIPDSVIEAFVKAAGGDKAKLVVIPTASASADKEPAKTSIDLWQKRGIANVNVLHTRSREQANNADYVKPLKDATAIWFGGGDQKKITDAYKGTLVETEMHALLKRGGTIGGTSAGAAIMSKLMITGGKTTADLAEGFGFLPNAVVDQHFLKRDRADRLLGVLHRHPGWFGVGIDEGTAAVVTGKTITIVGDSMAVLVQRSTPDLPASCRILHSGAKVDLIEMSRTALERAKSASPEAGKK
jgi:cyanophycinase